MDLEETYGFGQSIGAVDHDSAHNVGVGRAHALMSIHGDVQKSVGVCIGAAAAADITNCQLGNVEDFTDVGDESLWGEAIDAITVVYVVQAAVS